MRQSGETMCEENLALVNAVKKYPCLYNFGIPEYMKKEETDAAWIEVANSIRQTVHECKEKWRNLRYSFLRSLKPHRDGSSKKKYYLHKEMEFLVPFMKTRFETIITPPYDEESEDETVSNFITNAEESNVAEESTNTMDYNCTLDVPHAEPLVKRRKTTHKLTKDHGNNECPRKMFLLSLLPEINNLREVEMKAFRRKVFTLLDDITKNDDDMDNNARRGSNESSSKAKTSEEMEFITTIKAEQL